MMGKQEETLMEQEMLWVGYFFGFVIGLFAGYAFWGSSREAWYWARRIEEQREGRD